MRGCFLQPIFSIATLSKVDYRSLLSSKQRNPQEITVKKTKTAEIAGYICRKLLRNGSSCDIINSDIMVIINICMFEFVMYIK